MVSHKICSSLRNVSKFLRAQKSIEIQVKTKEVNSILIIYFETISEGVAWIWQYWLRQLTFGNYQKSCYLIYSKCFLIETEFLAIAESQLPKSALPTSCFPYSFFTFVMMHVLPSFTLTHFITATTNRKKERETYQAWSYIQTEPAMYMALFFSDFYRSFVIHKFLYGSFVFFCDNTGGEVGWGAWVRKEKTEKSHFNIL